MLIGVIERVETLSGKELEVPGGELPVKATCGGEGEPWTLSVLGSRGVRAELVARIPLGDGTGLVFRTQGLPEDVLQFQIWVPCVKAEGVEVVDKTDFPKDDPGDGGGGGGGDVVEEEVRFGAEDLKSVHPNFVSCTDSSSGEPVPAVCSLVSVDITDSANDYFRAPATGSIEEMTVRQPQISEVPGVSPTTKSAVPQTISIQVFNHFGGTTFGGGRFQQVGHISGAGTFNLPVNPPFAVTEGELVGIRIQPDAVGPFYYVTKATTNHQTYEFGFSAPPLGDGETREPNDGRDGDIPVQFSLDPAG